MHWRYSLPGYEHYSIEQNGVPIVTHLHGGHSDFQFDGNPEFFWSPDYAIVGPQWAPLGGIIKDFVYLNDQPAGDLWYHGHALGITRLNVYAGMAGSSRGAPRRSGRRESERGYSLAACSVNSDRSAPRSPASLTAERKI